MLVAIKATARWFDEAEPQMCANILRRERYQREKLLSRNTETEVFVREGCDPIRELLAGYRPVLWSGDGEVVAK